MNTQDPQKRLEYLDKLLRPHNAQTLGFDPGVLVNHNISQEDGRVIGVSLDFDRAEWSFVEKVLLENRKLKRKLAAYDVKSPTRKKRK